MTPLEKFFSSQNLDIRKKGNNPRFIDQKCTPDVISFIADVILNLNMGKFSRFDIEKSDYFCKFVVITFGKPSPKNRNLHNEYDKFISQSLDLLAYAGILKKEKVGRKNLFSIINEDILEYIALKDRNAYLFIVEYLNKFFKDCDFEKYLNIFFENQNKENFSTLKEKFEKLIISNSNLGTRGSETGGILEARRMFPKAINPLALAKQKNGTARGYLSSGIITYSELIYNRNNFRDVGKLKNVSRSEQLQIEADTKDYNKYLMTKAKQWVRKNHPQSEIHDSLYGETTHAHHMFPRSEYPTIADYIENLIALTAGQHMQRAHPNGNTTQIDLTYQCVCLKAKKETIQKEIESGSSTQYSKQNFIHVLNTGFNWLDNPKNEIEHSANFEVIDRMIDSYYKTH